MMETHRVETEMQGKRERGKETHAWAAEKGQHHEEMESK